MIKSNLTCQGCGYKMDSAECLYQPEAKLSRGDLSVCLNCGMLYHYDDPGWHRMTRKERRGLDKKTKAWMAQMEFHRRQVITEDLAFNQQTEP